MDPILLANRIKENFALHFFGEYKAKFESILSRLEPLFPEVDKQDELLKMRGPFLQALPIPRWGDGTWPQFAAQVRGVFAPAGLHAAVVDGLAAAGIRRLHRFQEEAITRIIDDKDTLVVAGTGRGKSESWLIPLFQYIVDEKLAGRDSGTKALLIYPTKALAQDQFRRIIGYLLQINQRLPGKPITIGIYDGDTPYKGDRNLEPFLAKSFKFMDCPRKGTKSLCADCINTTAQVEVQAGRARLTAAERQCQGEVVLDFIYLTREDLLAAEVDILITNPDTINFQLININNPTTRKVFIEQPRFIVLDEVHIYNGLFGAFTAMLMRRLRQVRFSLHVTEPLRFIAASATVQNKEEIFERLCAVDPTAAVVQEESAEFPPMRPGRLPGILQAEVLDEERLLRVWQGASDSVYEQLVLDLGLSRPAEVSILPPDVSLGEQILEKLTQQPEPRLTFLADIYRQMRREAHTPSQLREWLQSTYGLSSAGAHNLFENFNLLGGLAGILERRAHLFAWALDGYYTCAACGKVYASPKAKCDCGNHFVSRFAFCTHCGEEVLEVWACPKCLHVYPMVASRDGESLFFDPPVCSCGGPGSHGTTTVRALVHPGRECRACGNVYYVPQSITCPTCEAWLVQEGDRMVCSNPECGSDQPLPEHLCPSCREDRAGLRGFSGFRCEHCGELTQDGHCCDTTGMPALAVPWICGQCGEAHFTPKPPALCTCGKAKFYWGALLDPARVIHDGGADWMPGRKLGTPVEVSYDNYKLMAPDGRLMNVTDGGRPLMPCHHPYTRWTKKRFQNMVRTPENILATSSQILLRTLLRDDGQPLDTRLMASKMLTFSDSHRDMENVNRNFNEPERRHFLEAMAFSVLAKHGRLTLTDLIVRTVESVEQYGAGLYGTQQAPRIYNDLVPGRYAVPTRKRIVREDVESLFRPRNVRQVAPLVVDGIAGLQMDEAKLNLLDGDARNALARFWGEMHGRKASGVYGDKKWTVEEVSALRALETRGILKREEERLYLAADILQVWLIGPGHPGLWSPRSNAFHSLLDVQLGRRSSTDLVRYEVDQAERCNADSRFFSLRAYELTYSPAALLASRVYKGDTSKEKRRETEHIFKAKPFLHHISSGPAMEVGIDIGNLNALALYGTPPNVNGYLQRVGRAGRRSKRSLVLAVSKSNPIDFYYYRWPLKLIDSKPQPVPLTDRNREVLRISLTWAVLDYVASHYWVPWVISEVAAGGEVQKMVKTNGMHTPVSMPPAGDYQRLSKLFRTEIYRLANGDTLNALSHVLTADQAEVREWLETLVAGILDPVEAGEMIEQVLTDFAGNVYGFVKELFNEVDERLDDLDDKLSALRKQLRNETGLTPEDQTQLEVRRSQIRTEMEQLESLREGLKRSKLMELQQISRRKRYAYNLRNVSDYVEIHRRGPAGEEEEGNLKTEALPARELNMALTEYHPAAMVLREETKHVVTHLFPEKMATTRLQGKFGKLRTVCANCGNLMPEGTVACDLCGSSEVHAAHLVVPGRVVITSATQKLHDQPMQGMPVFTAQLVYRTADDQDKIEKTFPLKVEAIADSPSSSPVATVYLTRNGLVAAAVPEDPVDVVLTFTGVDLVTFVPGYSATFEDGRREQVSLFLMCGEDGCGGVIRQGAQPFCSHDPNHDPTRGHYIVPARQFITRAVKIEVAGDSAGAARLAHSLAHGLRMALQQIAGVDLRQLGEVQQGDAYYIFEDVEGGYGITDLLLLKDEQGRLPNLVQALEMIRDHVSGGVCKCDDGCPFCLYQYGCTNRNRPASLTRRGLLTLLENRTF